MRDYSRTSARFWTGDTGKWLRAQGRDHQVLAMYLFTCPSANMIGLYYLNLPTLIHEVGNIDREGALEVLRSLSEGGYATFHEPSETVFVVEMAKHQIGETISKKDNRHVAIIKLLEQYRKSPFFNDFLDRYSECFKLESVIRNGEFHKPLARGSEAPSKPGTGAGAGTGAGRGSEGGAGTGSETGTGTRAQEPSNHAPTGAADQEDFSGEESPPKDPSSRSNGSAVRRNGDFESINDAVSKLLASGVCTAKQPDLIAKLAHISTNQARESLRQLRDRGRLPAEVAA